MTDPAVAHAAKATGPGAGTKATVTSGGSIAATDLSAYEGMYVAFYTTEDVHIVFGTAAMTAAVTTDMLMTSNMGWVERFVSPTTAYFRAIAASTTASLYYAPTSDNT